MNAVGHQQSSKVADVLSFLSAVALAQQGVHGVVLRAAVDSTGAAFDRVRKVKMLVVALAVALALED